MLRNAKYLVLAALIVSASSTAAQSQVEVGVLSCRGATTSFILASRTDLACSFRRNDGRVFRYSGVIRVAGVDLTVNQARAIEWGVFAPTRNINPGDLSGFYGGVSAGALVEARSPFRARRAGHSAPFRCGGGPGIGHHPHGKGPRRRRGG